MSGSPTDERSVVSPVVRGVLEVARSMLDEFDVERVLEQVLESARELTGARYAAMGVLDETGTALARFITIGVDEETRRRIGSLPTGRGVLGELISNPVSLRLAKVGEHPRSFGFPAGHPAMETFLGVPLLVADRPYGNLYLTDKQGGGVFTHADEEALVLLAEFAGVAIDHARRVSSLESRGGELQQTVDALDAMVQISLAVGGQTDLAAVLELVAKRGRALVSARAVFIELERDGNVVVAAVAGEASRDMVGREFVLAGSVADGALRTQRPQRLEHELNRARFDEHGLGSLGITADYGLVVPLIFRGRALGALIALDRLDGQGQFGADEERLLEAFAASAANAVASAQSVTAERLAERLAASERERGRWARELHDETLQDLAAVRLHLANAMRAGDREALHAAVAAAVGQLDDEITGLRSLITDLRPPALDQIGTQAAIEALTARAAGNGVEVDVHVDLAYEQGRATQRLLPEHETAIYRIVQEALTNAVKHGGASRAVVEVIEQATTIEIAVRDDGSGFDPADPTAGFGMLGMRERAELLHGTCEIDSTPGNGAVVRATLPVQRRHATASAPNRVSAQQAG